VQGRQYVEVAAGDYHTCVRTAMNTVECWGAGSPESETVVGSPDYDQATPPEVMGFIDTVDQISAGAYHTCAAVTRAGLAESRVGCWGAGLPFLSTWPHLGQSTPAEGEYVRVVAGGLHSCGLNISGEITCWGAGTSVGDCANSFEECGQADPPITSGFRFITAGHGHTCGIGVDGAVICWGAGETEGACDQWSFECGQSLPPDDLY